MPFTTSYHPADTDTEVLDLTVGDLLRRAAATAPERTALVGTSAVDGTERRWTYGELLVEAEHGARALLAHVTPGERVAVWAPNVAEWVVLELGAALAGTVLVTVNPGLRASEVAYVLEQSGAAALFVVEEYRGNPMAAIAADLRPDLPELRSVLLLDRWAEFLAGADPTTELPEVGPDDAVQIQYTSGTTGAPKGALLHHRGIVNNARFCAERVGLAEGVAWVNPMPLFHTGGCVLAALGSLWVVGTHVLVLAFDPAAVLALVESERAGCLGGVPTMLLALMEHPDLATRDLTSLTSVVSGGSTVPPDLVRRIEATLGVAFVIVYGMTELSPVATETHPDDTAEDKALTIGTPLPQVECRIIDPATGDVVPVGVSGEFCARGYQVMHGYWRNPEATAETIDADGWLRTGDLCSMDERGYFTVTGRLKDMIIRGGENVYPREIEDLLITHPAVADVAVVGIPDDRWGETVAAVVRPLDAAAPPSPTDLEAFCRASLASHKVPRRWFVVAEFPLTGSGKVQKFVLRERAEGGALTPLA